MIVCQTSSAREGIAKQCDVWLRAGLQIHTYDVEAVWWISSYLAKKFTRYPGKIFLLIRIDGGFSGLYRSRGAGFDLNETEGFAIPTDKIKLTTAPRTAIVSRHHHITQISQIKVSLFFATAAGQQMIRTLVPAQNSGGGIQDT